MKLARKSFSELQGAITEMQIILNCCHLSCINTTEMCNTAMKREFCGLFRNIFKNCEKVTCEA